MPALRPSRRHKNRKKRPNLTTAINLLHQQQMNRIFASSGRSLLFRARAWGNVQPRMLQPSLTSASLSPATSQSPLQHQSIRRYQEQQNDANSNRVYSQLAFYKNETCLSVDPVAPNIIHREKYFQLKKPGTLILSFGTHQRGRMIDTWPEGH